jgi:hypothetical protein
VFVAADAAVAVTAGGVLVAAPMVAVDCGEGVALGSAVGDGVTGVLVGAGAVAVAASTTFTTPDIAAPWTRQKYWNAPAALNVWLNVPDVWNPAGGLLSNDASFAVTECGLTPAHVHWTVSPTLIVMLAWSKKLSFTETLAVAACAERAPGVNATMAASGRRTIPRLKMRRMVVPSNLETAAAKRRQRSQVRCRGFGGLPRAPGRR